MKRKIGVGIVAVVLAITSAGIASTSASAAVGKITAKVGSASCVYDATRPNNNSTRAGNNSCHRVAAQTRSYNPSDGTTLYRNRVEAWVGALSPTPSGHFYAGGRTYGSISVTGAELWSEANVL